MRGVRRCSFAGSPSCCGNLLAAASTSDFLAAAVRGFTLGTAADARLDRGMQASAGTVMAGCGSRGLCLPTRCAFAATAEGLVQAVSAVRYCVMADATGLSVEAE